MHTHFGRMGLQPPEQGDRLARQFGGITAAALGYPLARQRTDALEHLCRAVGLGSDVLQRLLQRVV